jgi:hypothetical protein
MYTPPRLANEISWLRDQSPVHAGTRTPPQQCSMPPRFWINFSAMSTGLIYNKLLETPDISTPTLVNPASTLLQDLLKEQRAHRSSRGPLPEDWDDVGPRTPDGSRIQEDSASEKARKVSEALTTGQRQPKEMGMREMDQVGPPRLNQDLDTKLTPRPSTFQK